MANFISIHFIKYIDYTWTIYTSTNSAQGQAEIFHGEQQNKYRKHHQAFADQLSHSTRSVPETIASFIFSTQPYDNWSNPVYNIQLGGKTEFILVSGQR